MQQLLQARMPALTPLQVQVGHHTSLLSVLAFVTMGTPWGSCQVPKSLVVPQIVTECPFITLSGADAKIGTSGLRPFPGELHQQLLHASRIRRLPALTLPIGLPGAGAAAQDSTQAGLRGRSQILHCWYHCSSLNCRPQDSQHIGLGLNTHDIVTMLSASSCLRAAEPPAQQIRLRWANQVDALPPAYQAAGTGSTQ